MIVAVTLTQHHCLRGIPWQEVKRILGLDILLVPLLQKRAPHPARRSIVRHESHVVLISIELKDIDSLGVGRPRNVSMIVVLLAEQLKPGGLT